MVSSEGMGIENNGGSGNDEGSKNVVSFERFRALQIIRDEALTAGERSLGDLKQRQVELDAQIAELSKVLLGMKNDLQNLRIDPEENVVPLTDKAGKTLLETYRNEKEYIRALNETATAVADAIIALESNGS